MIQNRVDHFFFYLFAFVLFFGVSLYNILGVKNIGGIAFIVLLALYIRYVIITKNSNFQRGLPFVLLIFLCYLNYSFHIASNIHEAILYDLLVQLAPYLTFFMVSQMAPSLSESQKKQLRQLCFLIWLLFVPIALYGLHCSEIYDLVLEKPENFVTSITVLSLVYLYCSNFSNKSRSVFILMLSLSLLARFKNIGFFFLTLGILLFFHRRESLRSNTKIRISVSIIIILTLYLTNLQIINELFPTSEFVGNNDNFMTRSAIYDTSLKIFQQKPFLGSGFASFGSYASGLYYSPLYTEYGLHSITGLTPEGWSSIYTAFYPSLAQFGIIGVCLYLFFWAFFISKSLTRYKQKKEIQPFAIILILACFIFIQNASDSLFTGSKGLFIMMFFGLLFGHTKKEAKHRKMPTSLIPINQLEEELETVPEVEDEQNLPEELETAHKKDIKQEFEELFSTKPLYDRKTDVILNS